MFLNTYHTLCHYLYRQVLQYFHHHFHHFLIYIHHQSITNHLYYEVRVYLYCFSDIHLIHHIFHNTLYSIITNFNIIINTIHHHHHCRLSYIVTYLIFHLGFLFRCNFFSFITYQIFSTLYMHLIIHLLIYPHLFNA
jgi:hypothetical protein